MLCLRVGHISVEFDRAGDLTFNKSGMINWLGKPVLVLAGPYTFHFDLEGRVQRIDGLAGHPWDWLQRTMANDWIYYDKVWEPHRLPEPSGLIGDSYWAVNGRTDLPMLRDHNGLRRDYVAKAYAAFDELAASIRELVKRRPEVVADAESTGRLWDFLGGAARNDRAQLQTVADRLHELHGHMAVLPPDTIRVDYRVLPIKLMDGCTNNCGFCAVRGDSPFAIRDKPGIDRQIEGVAEVYGADLYNYNSVVFGECDALVSPWLEYAANRAFESFRCGSSIHAGSNLFMFTTTRTLREQPDATFDMLEALPFEKVCINVGWEAATDDALSRLGKQQTAQEVFDGMEKAGRINRTYKKVRVSGNFIAGDGSETESIVETIRATGFAGQLFVSPLLGQCSSEKALQDLRAIRTASPHVRAHLYTMQRM